MQGDKTIPLADLINGLASVLQRDDLTEQERTAVERAIYLLNTE